MGMLWPDIRINVPVFGMRIWNGMTAFLTRRNGRLKI